jgi:hypothetical protein
MTSAPPEVVARARIELATPRFSVKEIETMFWQWLQGLF